MWVCDWDWEDNQGWWDPIMDYMWDCPDGSSPTCKVPHFTAAACDLLTGWFMDARDRCRAAQKEYDMWYDYDYLELGIMPPGYGRR